MQFAHDQLRSLLRRISSMATQSGFKVPQEDYEKSSEFLRFSGSKDGKTRIDVQLTPTGDVLVSLTELKDDGSPKLGSNVLHTHFNNALNDVSIMLSEYFR